MKTVLHVGCGPARGHLPPWFAGWREVCTDIDAAAQPDIVADMRALPVAAESFDGIWSSHTLEHVHPEDAEAALAEFFRVLAPSGFLTLTLPDIQVAAQKVGEGKGDAVAYDSPAGPVTWMDMVFGKASMTEGNPFMAHRWGWTAESLTAALGRAGFRAVNVARGDDFALWALAVKHGDGA